MSELTLHGVGLVNAPVRVFRVDNCLTLMCTDEEDAIVLFELFREVAAGVQRIQFVMKE